MMKSAIAGNNGAIFEHIAADELRLELERMREELHTFKKQLTERDSELLQLKTAHRKLQDALRKKDKDLQNVFAVLRAPQDAELTKKRKTELVERLLTETQQRVVNAEAVAEERKHELDKFKFSSKFLRYQELEVENEECHAEIERLHVELSQYAVVGKLKVSRARVDGLEKTKTPTKPPGRRSSGNQHGETTPMRPAVERATQAVKPLPLPTAQKRGSFVDKTRKAVELEYNKQLRLAELEAECELEENLRIRAKREAQAQAEARRRQRQQDAAKSRNVVAMAAVKPTTDTPAKTRSSSVVEDVSRAVDVASTPSEMTVIALEKAAINDEVADSGKVSSTDSTEEGAGQSAEEVAAVAASIAAVVEEVVDAVEHERRVDAVEEPSEAQQPKQYDEDDFDDGAEDERDDVESESVVEEASTAGETTRKAQDDAPTEEKEAVDEVEDSTDNKPEPTATREEVYEDDEPGEDVAPNASERQPVTFHEATGADGTHRQGFVVPVNPLDEAEEVYKPLESEHKQGFVVEPTYDSEGLAEPAQDNGNVDTERISVREGTVVKTETQVEATVEQEPAAQRPRVVVEEPTSERGKRASYTTAATTELKEESLERPDGEPAASTKEIIPTESLVEPTEKEDATRNNNTSAALTAPLVEEVDESDAETTDHDPSQSVPLPEVAAHESDVVDTAADSETPSSGNTTVDTTHTDPPVDETLTIAQTIHDCDDAIDAATATIHRQIDSALAESTPLPATTEASSSLAEATTSLSFLELTASELAAAMDAAARKIQRFWREMERKYASTPVVETPTTVTPRSGHSGTSTPMESAESPVVSETEGW